MNMMMKVLLAEHVIFLFHMKAGVEEVQRPVKHLIPTDSSSVGAKWGI